MTNFRTPNRTTSLVLSLAAYVVATAVAVGVVYAEPFGSMLYDFAVADVAATLLVFFVGAALRNASIYDPYWSLAPIVIAAGLWLLTVPEVPGRAIVVSALVGAWGVRLTYNFYSGWSGLDHEDWRYDALRKKHGKLFFFVNLTGIHLMPTVLVFLGCLPLFAIFGPGPAQDLGILDLVGLTIMGSGIALEGFADSQLRQFIRQQKTREPGDKPALLAHGLWGRCRHPNYLGEITFWWGLYIFSLAHDLSYWWTGAGALLIHLLFVTISIPMIEKRMRARRPQYDEYASRIRSLWPFPRSISE
ncbi:MAG: DUF1295 domain-containing protein [Myxococcota bacterium]